MDGYASRRRIGLMASLSEMPDEVLQWSQSVGNALTVPVLTADSLGAGIATILGWGYQSGLLVSVCQNESDALRLAWIRVEPVNSSDVASGDGRSVLGTASVGDVFHLVSPGGLCIVEVGGESFGLRFTLSSPGLTDAEAASEFGDLMAISQ